MSFSFRLFMVALVMSIMPFCSTKRAFAQDVNVAINTRRPLPATKLAGEPPKIDGDISDTAWKTASKAEIFTDTQTERSAPEQTTVYLLYDRQYIYIAFDCRDSQPDGIVGRETVRDSHYNNDGGSEDFVEVSFDTFLSYKGNDFARFGVNPLGTRSAQIGGGRASKAEWNGEWDASAKRTSTGWTAEMRIPWATLNYPNSRSKPLTMGINFSRFHYRTRVYSVWSNTHQQGFNEFEGRWTDVEVPANAFKPKLSVLPYVLPSLGELNSTDTHKKDFAVRTGVDARYTLTPDLTAVGSINPDFATIEGAIQSIAFSRSERFVPERRPFFLEGGNFFNAGTGFAFGPLFYSNRIPVFDLGTKVFGKITPRDTLGVLTTFDFAHRFDAVARYRHDLSPTSQIGLFTTVKSYRRDHNKPDDVNDNNQVSALLSDWRSGKFGVGTQFATSGGDNAGGGFGEVNLTYSDTGGHFTSFQTKTIDGRFRDANGLIYFTDYKGFSLYHEWYKEIRGTKGMFRNFDLNFSPQYTWHQNGKPFQRGINFGIYTETRSDLGFGINGNYDNFDTQTDRTIDADIIFGASNRFKRIGFHASTGIQANQSYRFFGPSFSWRAINKLDLIYEGGLQQQNGESQQHILTANYEITPTRSIGGRVVLSTTPGSQDDAAHPNGESNINAYLSYRNSGEKGTEYYFILGDPNAQRFTPRIAMKVIFAL